MTEVDKAIERLQEYNNPATKDGAPFIDMLKSIVDKRDVYFKQILDEIDKSVVSPGMQPRLKPES